MEELGVEAVLLHEFLVGAVFGDDAVLDYRYLVAAHGHRDALRDHDGRLADENLRERLLNLAFCVGVEG